MEKIYAIPVDWLFAFDEQKFIESLYEKGLLSWSEYWLWSSPFNHQRRVDLAAAVYCFQINDNQDEFKKRCVSIIPALVTLSDEDFFEHWRTIASIPIEIELRLNQLQKWHQTGRIVVVGNIDSVLFDKIDRDLYAVYDTVLKELFGWPWELPKENLSYYRKKNVIAQSESMIAGKNESGFVGILPELLAEHTDKDIYYLVPERSDSPFFIRDNYEIKLIEEISKKNPNFSAVSLPDKTLSPVRYGVVDAYAPGFDGRKTPSPNTPKKSAVPPIPIPKRMKVN